MLNIGFGNYVFEDKVLAIIGPDSAPVKRLVQNARDKNLLIDATCGRKTRAVLVLAENHILLSALQRLTNGCRACRRLPMNARNISISFLCREIGRASCRERV